jgi:dienelactone hydrolase
MSRGFWGVALVALYLLWTGTLAVMAPRLIYPFAQTPFRDPAFTMRDVGAGDGLTLAVAVAPGAPDRPVILFFMGNYGARAGFRGLLEPLVSAGFGVVAMPYRGGEGLAGPASEAALKADALRVHEALSGWPDIAGRPVHVLGYSLGSGLALHVAAERATASTVLIAPYDRLCAVAARRTLTPACLVPGVPRWDNAALAPRVGVPVLLIHGDDDRLIPPRHGQSLALALGAADVPLALLVQPGAGHNDIGVDPRVLGALAAWFDGGWRAARATDAATIGSVFHPANRAAPE